MKSIKNKISCHSGGAEGADSYFEALCEKHNIAVLAYSYKTEYHNSKNKVELSENEFLEGVLNVNIANQTLQRFKIKRYLKLLSRCWFQVKYSEQIFAISTIVIKNNSEFVKGGTGFTIQMAIDNKKEIFLFDQEQNEWLYWNYFEEKFQKTYATPKIESLNFGGIGARKINVNGIIAIEQLFTNSFL